VIHFLGTNGQFAFNREVLRGFWFIGDSTLSVVSVSSSEIVMAQAAFLALYHFPFLPEFNGGRSNNYTLDHAFDFPNAHSTINGVEFSSGVFLHWTYHPGEFSPRIQVDFTLGSSVEYLINVPPTDSPWYVRP
jgi:hypothetical protein